jgi:hypothetical protein
MEVSGQLLVPSTSTLVEEPFTPMGQEAAMYEVVKSHDSYMKNFTTSNLTLYNLKMTIYYQNMYLVYVLNSVTYTIMLLAQH